MRRATLFFVENDRGSHSGRGRAVVLGFVLIATAYATATAQEANESPNDMADVDVQARFDEFQRDFAKDFGVKLRDEGERRGERRDEGIAAKFERDFAKRWEGSGVYRWYEKAAGVYDRVEGLYNRIEFSTRWATRGVDVNPDVDAVLDGKLRLHVERDVGRLNMGFDVDDAMAGRLGLRLGGTVRGYRVSFDVSDIVEVGRFGFQIRKSFK